MDQDDEILYEEEVLHEEEIDPNDGGMDDNDGKSWNKLNTTHKSFCHTY